MKKIILTENQLNMIKNHINEGSDDRYRREVSIDLEYYRTSFKGNDINDIVCRDKMVLTFLIEQEHRSWGVKDISLYSIIGVENTLECEVEYFINENETKTETIELPLDWEKLETDSRNGEGVITIGDSLQIVLANDENGNLVVENMNIDVYTL